MEKKRKAPMLTLSARKRIGEFKEKNPNFSFYQLAEKFNCSYSQARKACEDYNSGKFEVKQISRKKKKTPGGETSEVINQILTDTLNEINDGDLTTAQKVAALSAVANTHKKLREMQLSEHLKRSDSEVIATIVRFYEPDATDERIIEVYREAVELLKSKQ